VERWREERRRDGEIERSRDGEMVRAERWKYSVVIYFRLRLYTSKLYSLMYFSETPKHEK
jgi:hypothetical protein